jgi:hypothetical protein
LTRTNSYRNLQRDLRWLEAHELGESYSSIAKREGKDVSSVKKALKKAREYREQLAPLRQIGPGAKDASELTAEARRMLEWSSDGFERFFNAFSQHKLSGIHKRWVQDAIDNPRVLLNVPPGHAKSTVFAIWFPIWLITRDRNVRILIISKTADLVSRFGGNIAAVLENNSALVNTFGRYKPMDATVRWRPATGELQVEGMRRVGETNEMNIMVRGSGQQVLGFRADWVICDDPTDARISRSETDRSNHSAWFHEEVMTRLTPTGRAIVIGQRVHLKDLYGELAEEKAENGSKYWHQIIYPAVLDWETKEVLWPEFWPWDRLMVKRGDIGSERFEQIYQQNPLPPERALARHEWIFGDDEHPGCLDVWRSFGPIPSDSAFDPTLSRVRVVALDPSPTRFAGLVVGEVYRTPSGGLDRILVLEMVREKMSVRDMVAQIERCISVYEPDYLIFEQNAAQRWLLQDPNMDRLRQRVRVRPHTTTGRNKADPQLGVESLAVEFEFGRIRLPYGDAESRAMSQMLIQEAKSYPQGETDDLLMALWFIRFNAGFLVSREQLAADPARPRWHVPPRLAGKAWPWARQTRMAVNG